MWFKSHPRNQKEKVAHRATFSFCLRRWLAPLELRVIATSYARWGSELSAACGGRSEVSEWQRSQRATERREGRPMRAPQQGKQTRSVCENNPEVVWFKSHPRNQKEKVAHRATFSFCLRRWLAPLELRVIATSYARWGSELSAACGGRSEVSEWQRSQRATERREGRPMRAPQQGKQTRSVCENNPEVVWFKSHPRNQKEKSRKRLFLFVLFTFFFSLFTFL